MATHRCPKCGEEYSDTYRSCPFCEEEDAIKHGRPLRRRGGRRLEKRPSGSGGAGGIMLLLMCVIILCVVGYVAFGDDVADAVGIRDAQPAPPPDASQTEPQAPPSSDGQTPEPPVPNEDEPAPSVDPVISDEPPVSDEPAEPSGPLALSQTDITIPAGETGRLTASGGSGEVTWSSSNPEIASVDNGAVTGKAGGTVTITASSGEETATCQVKVEGEPWVDPNPSIYRLNREDFTLSSSETSWQMKVKKDNGKWEIMGPNEGVTWASSNTGVASISETGLVTKTGKGTTQISATVGGVTLECTVRMS
ncbi:MAG: hypothetical protein HFF72_02680 [Oscillospiraceae bacterium]|jgi:hypothetical protein|nr:hypothetical protein [Oscillospiraceae bacterium]